MTLDLTPVAGLTATQSIGIPIALAGAVLMSLGALFQHRGVARAEARSGELGGTGLSLRQLSRLLRSASWVVGTLMLLAAIALQLVSLMFAPLIIVQPLGVVSLLLTTLLTARQSGTPLSAGKWLAVGMCVLGIGAFVTVAAFFATEIELRDRHILTVLAILGVVVAAFLVAFVVLRKRFGGLFYIVGAGVIYGFVATLAKITINRIQHGSFEWLAVVCVLGILAGTAVGAYFVQTAYSLGTPDMVVAGLTVVDPLVAVLIGVLVLGEATGAPWYAAALFLVFGAIAAGGVLLLERGQSAAEAATVRERAVGAVRPESGGTGPGSA